MKTYKSSDLTHKRAEVLEEAALDGVVIQVCNTNGKVRQEFFLLATDSIHVKTDLILDFPFDDKG